MSHTVHRLAAVACVLLGSVPPAFAQQPAAAASPADAASEKPATEPAADSGAAAASPGTTVPAPDAAPKEGEGSAAKSSQGLPETAADDSMSSATDAAATDIIASTEATKLEIYGFADVSYFHTIGPTSAPLREYVTRYPSFFVGHFNVYLASQLSENWRSLAEVRFMYSPLGDSVNPAADGSFPAQTNESLDYTDLGHNISWGGIEIQRAWVEYQAFNFLTLRAGQWFTPYGFWNEDHGSPTILGVHKPFPIGDVLFPDKQTGLEAYGKFFIDSTAIGYALTLSNGRGPYDAIRDLDNNKAIGGHLYVETNAVGQLTAGISAYRGRYTASTKKYRVNTSSGQPMIEFYRHLDKSFEELSLGAELRWRIKDFQLQAEVMENEGAYNDKARPTLATFNPSPTYAADFRRLGAYGLVSYRLPWFDLTPYALAEHLTFSDNDYMPPLSMYSGGINWRPTPNVALKAEYGHAQPHGLGSVGIGRAPLSYFGSQIAWAF